MVHDRYTRWPSSSDDDGDDHQHLKCSCPCLRFIFVPISVEHSFPYLIFDLISYLILSFTFLSFPYLLSHLQKILHLQLKFKSFHQHFHRFSFHGTQLQTMIQKVVPIRTTIKLITLIIILIVIIIIQLMVIICSTNRNQVNGKKYHCRQR